jgi:branched-chain amino acid transport system substrate-binding protein
MPLKPKDPLLTVPIFSSLLFFALLIGAFGLMGCRQEVPNSSAKLEPILIGFFGALTGNAAGLGQYTDMGATLAVEEINASGGVRGRPLELRREDNRSLAGESATIVKKLLSRDQVVAIVGDANSGRCLEAGPLCQAAGIPMISPAATLPQVTEIGDFIFRICFTDPFQGKIMAQFARKNLSLKRVGFLLDATSPYSLGLADVFRDRFTAEGGLVIGEQRYNGGDKDFRAQLTALKAIGVEAIFAPGYYHSGGLILRQARELGLTLPMLGGDGWEAPELIAVGGPAADGAYFPVHFSAENPTPATRAFLDRFHRRFGKLPTGVSALAFDTLQMIADALRRSNSIQPKAIRDELAVTHDFAGITGLITMDSHRNAQKSAVIVGVKAGSFQFVSLIEP